MTGTARWREERNAEIVRLAKLGVSTARIARIMHMAQSTVAVIRREAEVGAKRRPPLTQEQKDQAYILMTDGASRREAAKSVGCSEDQLQRAFPDMAWDSEQKRLAEIETQSRRVVDDFWDRKKKASRAH
jgi:DNA invertase Pin-like site-specific DNA recombinase